MIGCQHKYDVFLLIININIASKNLGGNMKNELVPVEENTPAVSTKTIDPQAEKDIEQARKTYKQLLRKGKKGLDIAFDIVESSEHPRAVEVFSGLVSNLANVNKALIELHKAKKELREDVPAPQTFIEGGPVQNNLYVGSPKDLLELMQGETDEQ